MLLGTVGVLPKFDWPGAGETSAPVYWFTCAPDGDVTIASLCVLRFCGSAAGVVAGMMGFGGTAGVVCVTGGGMTGFGICDGNTAGVDADIGPNMERFGTAGVLPPTEKERGAGALGTASFETICGCGRAGATDCGVLADIEPNMLGTAGDPAWPRELNIDPVELVAICF